MNMSVYDPIQPYPVFSQSPISINILAFTEFDDVLCQRFSPFLECGLHQER